MHARTHTNRARRRLRGVIFDLDGLLINTEPLQYQAYRSLFAEYEVDFSRADFQTFVGRRALDVIRSVLCKAAVTELPETLKARRDHIYLDILRTEGRPMPGAIQLVTEVFRSGLKLGIASSSSLLTIAECLSLLELSSMFKTVASADHVPVGKPHPAVYQFACADMGLDPYECIALEDSETGVRAAIAADVPVVAVPNEFTSHQDFSQAAAVATSLTHLRVKTLVQIHGIHVSARNT